MVHENNWFLVLLFIPLKHQNAHPYFLVKIMNYLNKISIEKITNRAFFRSIGILLFSIMLIGCEKKATESQAAPLPEVDVTTVVLQSIQQWDQFNGHISAIESVEIRPRVSGYIQKIAFKEGDEVKKGDLLFLIDQRQYRATLDSAAARRERVNATDTLAQSQNHRAQTLLLNNATSKEEAETRQAALAQSHADIKDAQAALDMAKLNLGFTEVRAPITGRVSRAILTVGNLAVADQTTLTTIVSQDPVYVYFDPDEYSYLRYKAEARNNKGNKAKAKVRVGLADEQGFPHLGTLDFIDNQINSSTGTIRARAKLNNENRVFTPGMFARVQMAGDSEAQKILLDNKAILTDQDRNYVYVVGADNKAIRKDVVLGRALNGLRVIESGLASGDKVVVSGLQRIYFSGAEVKPNLIAVKTTSEKVAPTTSSNSL